MKKFFHNLMLFKLFLFFTLSACVTSAFAATTPLNQPKDLVFKTSVEFTPPSFAPGFTASEPYTPLWTTKDSTYYVYVDADYRAWVTQIKKGVATSQLVDPNPDYKVQADGHHRFSLGVDADGYIHVTGDMHHYSTFTDHVITPYPARYQKQSILYWKSNAPNDISKGFTFAGALNSPTTIPGGGWMLGRFFSDNNGVLYYSSMVHAYEAQNNSGQMAVGLYRYDTAKKTWTAIGGKATASQPGMINVFPVFYWEFAGLGPNKWFQNYQARFQFDVNNRLHFVLTANTNNNEYGANRLLYAVSSDGGNTWTKANGITITGLPLRGIDGLQSSAEVVAESNTSPGFDASPGLAIDREGNVAVSTNGTWYAFNGNTWTKSTPQNIGDNYPSARYGYPLPDNSLLYIGTSSPKLLYSTDLKHSPIGYDIQSFGSIANLDATGLKNTGVARVLTANSDQKTEVLLKTEIMHAPLPEGWLGKEISNTNPKYLGSAGYRDGIFTLNGYGAGIGNTSDSFYYVYKKMIGDGVITARVTSLTLSTPGQGFGNAGVMMRETLTPGSKHASMLIAPGTQNKGAMFAGRSIISSWGWSTSNASYKTTPYWVRLVRKGDLFTGYVSADGEQWTKIYSNTIAMNPNIFVGLATGSNALGYYNAVATFDNIASPAFN